ncbi:GNAT family N-acetyltransferase [Nocardioides sp. LHG3406-4]|uniref:GNAT family N-acetyltransferase n=1 Tax=Nocardioides sp. LHG3406-4 TaxID=2804575 RepID=UPI003CED1A0E
MSLEIVPVSPDDEDLFSRWHATYLAANVHEVGRFHACWALPELRVSMEPSRRRWSAGYAGLEGGRVVVAGFVAMPLLDNLDAALVQVHTLPEARRRGHGTAMLAVLEQVARSHGRTRLDSEATYPYAAGPAGDGMPAVAFAHGHGYTFGLSDVERELALPVGDDLLVALAAEAADAHASYTLRSWVGAVPDELVTSWLELSATLMTESPTGEMELEDEAVDVDALREAEEQQVRQGRERFHTAALDSDGTVVAYTDLVTTIHEPGRAYQWGTLVRRADRGHRLGLAVKVANQAQLQRLRPDITHLTTFNAEVNTHMIGVNERLGFEPVARLAEFQKRVG